MHMLIKVLVFARDEEGALNEAKRILENLCGDGRFFDYYTTFDEDGYGMSGKDRWGEMAPAVKVCTSLGSSKCNQCPDRFKCYTTKMNEAIEDIMQTMQKTKRSFLEHLKQIKKYLATHSDDQLFEEDDFKYQCYSVGQYEGPSVWLYDQDGEGITSYRHLHNVLNKWACNNNGKPSPEYKDKDLYVVPADVHW